MGVYPMDLGSVYVLRIGVEMIGDNTGFVPPCGRVYAGNLNDMKESSPPSI